MSDDADAPVPVALVTATVTTAPLPDGFFIPDMVAFARDLAINSHDLPVLLKKHQLTQPQYEHLKTVPYFQEVSKQLAEEWHAPKNVQQRLAIQTATGLEEVLPGVIARAKIKNEPLAGVAQLVKVLADICGANTSKNNAPATTEKFKITINLGADTEVYNKSKPSITVEHGVEAVPPSGSPSPIREIPEGLGNLLTLSPDPEMP